jgi:hypothetical protein
MANCKPRRGAERSGWRSVPSRRTGGHYDNRTEDYPGQSWTRACQAACNISQVCKMLGYWRDSFYRFKELVWSDWCQDVFRSFRSLVCPWFRATAKDDNSVPQAVASRKDQPWHHKYIDTEGSLPGASNHSRVLTSGGSRDRNTM